ncbi:MAG TPA: hypothetical protein VGN20_19895 [Mucilaginibacter sp.]|jgi:hypothetical protein
MTNQNFTISIRKLEIDKVFDLLTSVDLELKEYFDNYLYEEYKIDNGERLYYLDISEISEFVVNKIKSEQSYFLKEFFAKVEQIFSNCDTAVEELMVVGLFEGMQNTSDIDYYSGVDKWLLPISKIKWDNLIDMWEGTDWRKKNLK